MSCVSLFFILVCGCRTFNAPLYFFSDINFKTSFKTLEHAEQPSDFLESLLYLFNAFAASAASLLTKSLTESVEPLIDGVSVVSVICATVACVNFLISLIVRERDDFIAG